MFSPFWVGFPDPFSTIWGDQLAGKPWKSEEPHTVISSPSEISHLQNRRDFTHGRWVVRNGYNHTHTIHVSFHEWLILHGFHVGKLYQSRGGYGIYLVSYREFRA